MLNTETLRPGLHTHSTYSAGTLALLVSTFCIVGPRRQCDSMCQPKRLAASAAFLASLGGTLYFAFTGVSVAALVCVCVQVSDRSSSHAYLSQ
jgi:hypothetical protein